MKNLSKNNISKIYIVKYCGGFFEGYYELTIFATDKKGRATKYASKFNKILKKWKEHYKQYQEVKFDNFVWLKNEHIDNHFNRWSMLQDITRCYIEEVEIR